MADEKRTDDIPQTDISNATENLKIDSEQRENGDSGKLDKTKERKQFSVSVAALLKRNEEKVQNVFLRDQVTRRARHVPDVDILLKATGDAPIMKKKKWAVDAEKPIGWIMEFVKKYLKLEPEERLFLYVNQTFAPSPDQIIKNLYECFGTDGKLVLHYCKSQAWG